MSDQAQVFDLPVPQALPPPMPEPVPVPVAVPEQIPEPDVVPETPVYHTGSRRTRPGRIPFT